MSNLIQNNPLFRKREENFCETPVFISFLETLKIKNLIDDNDLENIIEAVVQIIDWIFADNARLPKEPKAKLPESSTALKILIRYCNAEDLNDIKIESVKLLFENVIALYLSYYGPILTQDQDDQTVDEKTLRSEIHGDDDVGLAGSLYK